MRAELVLMGKRVDMAAQSRRRTLVVLIYGGFAVLMAGLWFVDQWRASGPYILFATILVSRVFLGGTHVGGLVKPFNGKVPERKPELSPLFPLELKFGFYRPRPGEGEYRNDERELHQRDRAHYLAYQPVAIVLCIVWLLSNFKLHESKLPAWAPISGDAMVSGLLQATLVVMFTLPQCILLWTEPDMEEEAAI